MKKIVISAIIFGFISSAEADTNGISSSALKCVTTAYSVNIPANCEPVFGELLDYKIKHSKTKKCDDLLEVFDYTLRSFEGDNFSKLVIFGLMDRLETDCP